MSRQEYLSRAILSALVTASVLYSGTSMVSATSYHQNYYQGSGEKEITDGVFSSSNRLTTSSVRVVNNGTVLTLINPTIQNGEVGPDKGAVLNISGGTITSDGFNTEGGTINVEDATINAPVYAGYINKATYNMEGSLKSTFNITNSSIDSDLIIAGVGSTINLNGNDNTTYNVRGFMGSLAEDTSGTNAGTINLNGGVLVSDNLRALLDGSLVTSANTGVDDATLSEVKSRVAKGKIVLQNNGVIQTNTGQIFANAIDTSSEEAAKNSTDSGAVTNDYITYNGGTIRFTDKWYTQEYMNSAVSNMSQKGSTQLAFLGTLAGIEYIDVAQAIQHFQNNVYVTTPVKTEDSINTLSISIDNASEVSGTTQSTDSFNAAKLLVSSGLEKIEITNSKTLGLGGNADGELISGNTNPLTITLNKGTLKLGNTALSNTTTKNTLTATVDITDGTLEANGGQQTIVGDVTLTKGEINVKNSASLYVNGKLSTSSNGSDGSDTKINVGDQTSAGIFIAENAELGKNTVVYLDPVWEDGNDISDGSKAALVLSDNAISSKFIIGENSTLSLGTTDTTAAEKVFSVSGLTWGSGDSDVLSAVYLAKNHDVSNGVLIADKTAESTAADTAEAGTVTFANNSVLLVDGANITEEDNYAISGASTVTVGSTSKLYIDNADKGTYNVLSAANELSSVWSNDNLLSNITLLKLEGITTDPTKFIVSAKYQNVSDVYGNDVVINNLVDNTLQSDSISAGNSAYDFFHSAANKNINPTRATQVDAFNSAANLGELGAVNHATYSMNNIMTDSISDHLSLASHNYEDNDIWVKYIHNKETIDSVKLAGVTADYDASFNGIVVGGDFYNKGKATAGVAFTYADGNITGKTLNTRTKNEANYYGLSLYGKIDNGDSAILGDISYLHSSNDITQYNSGHKITASPNSNTFSLGVRAEKSFNIGKNAKIVPYAGIRYMHLGTGSYTNNLGMSYDVNTQNMWLLPIGVKYSTEIKNNKWTIRPMAEVGYVWTGGDREANQSVSLNSGINSFGFDTADSGSFIGKLGIQAENDNMAYGLGYEYQKGDTVSANRWMANLTFKF